MVTCRYVEQARNNKTNNRVYALKFTSTPKKVHFYWMQEVASAAEKDKELAEKVNSMINGDTQSSASGGSGGIGQLDQAQLMAMLTQAHSTASSATTEQSRTAAAPPAPASGETASTGDGAAPAPAQAQAQAQAAAEAGTDATPAAEGGTAEDADGDKMKVDDEEKQ